MVKNRIMALRRRLLDYYEDYYDLFYDNYDVEQTSSKNEDDYGVTDRLSPTKDYDLVHKDYDYYCEPDLADRLGDPPASVTQELPYAMTFISVIALVAVIMVVTLISDIVLQGVLSALASQMRKRRRDLQQSSSLLRGKETFLLLFASFVNPIGHFTLFKPQNS